ncbi:hypothetical protein F1847_03620 [Thermodesulfobacterium sp. TA1]|uniref:hypothetical protein n=1 Tax=Thermodesulfobacterium sp. TA1 TaxID=2234087 RepID=UPI0012327DB4|nr:hypothetical protein [Thermodesulfobacterium sp. TA1]QER41879.1 hypothetical protein F1847_03620 [Thermodesulfobacterium sp. TA1]
MKGETKKYLWDDAKSKDTLAFRKMCFEPYEILLEAYPLEYLKELYFKFYYQLDKRNKNFWKIILGISDEEINQKAKKGFREACKIWNY